jgi:hypothetical protein
MIPMPSGVRVWIATGHTDMQGLALQVQEQLKRDPHGGDLYLFRGREGRPGEDSLARRRRAVALCQAARPGKVHLAVGEGGRRVDLAGADGLHAGRNRLAESATDVAAEERGLSATTEAPGSEEKHGITRFLGRLKSREL